MREPKATSSSGLPRSPQSPDFEEEIQKLRARTRFRLASLCSALLRSALRRSGPELRRWLQKQLKARASQGQGALRLSVASASPRPSPRLQAPLVAWLKTLRLPTSGTKEAQRQFPLRVRKL